MGAPVEAQSLASLNRLLANPPQYPRNPTHDVQRPLILYIVRVPGSKDVFLTPLKPPTKASISLEAIQTSLYYLHVDTPEDDEVRQSLDEQHHAPRPENIPPVTRKPLPNVPQVAYSPSSPLGAGLDLFPPSYDGQNGDSNTVAQVSRAGLTRASSEHNGRNQSIRRKPVQSSSRQLPDEPGLRQDNLSHTFEAGQNGWTRPSSGFASQMRQDNHDNLPKLSTSMAQAMNGELSNATTSSRSNRWSQPPLRSMPDNGSTQSPTRSIQMKDIRYRRSPSAAITLIRRDPVSGAQWNIGKINQLDSSTYDSILRPVSVELDTPGYSKFVHQLEYPRPGSSRSTAGSIKQTMVTGELQEPYLDRDGLPTFTRTVEFREQPSSCRPFLQNRTNSAGSTPSSPTRTKPPKSVFSFTSPWLGLCTFSNGIDGKSLKCRHVLPTTNSQEESIAANIAELRFNLPWSVLGQRDTNKDSTMHEIRSETETPPISTLLKEPKSSKEAWRRSVQHLRNISKDINKRDRSGIENAYAANAGYSTNNSESELPPPSKLNQDQDLEDTHHRLSLKLGREKAGGGFKGNSAKLGKLIIEDEGLKMGDLVVAACMSVWWQHYAGDVGQ